MDQNLRSQEGSSRQNMLEHNILSSPAENFVFEVDLRLRKKKNGKRGASQPIKWPSMICVNYDDYDYFFN